MRAKYVGFWFVCVVRLFENGFFAVHRQIVDCLCALISTSAFVFVYSLKSISSLAIRIVHLLSKVVFKPLRPFTTLMSLSPRSLVGTFRRSAAGLSGDY